MRASLPRARGTDVTGGTDVTDVTDVCGCGAAVDIGVLPVIVQHGWFGGLMMAERRPPDCHQVQE